MAAVPGAIGRQFDAVKIAVATLKSDALALIQALFDGIDPADACIQALQDSGRIEIESPLPDTASIILSFEEEPAAILVDLGRNTHFELPISGNWEKDRESAQLLVAVIHAAIDGFLNEKVWYRDGAVGKSRSTLWNATGGRIVVNDTVSGRLWPSPFRRPTEEFTYEPWQVQLNEVVLDAA